MGFKCQKKKKLLDDLLLNNDEEQFESCIVKNPKSKRLSCKTYLRATRPNPFLIEHPKKCRELKQCLLRDGIESGRIIQDD